jgi:hypothetical protein
MPGASERTSRVTVLNANWTARPDGADGRFEVMIVTADGEKHILSPSPAALTALLAMAKTDVILRWDPDRTLIAANIVGTWLAPAGVTRVDLTTPGP